jgi:hypothetical protein
VLERASYPISGTDSRKTSTFGTGGPTVPSIGNSLGSETKVPAQVSVRPATIQLQIFQVLEAVNYNHKFSNTKEEIDELKH